MRTRFNWRTSNNRSEGEISCLIRKNFRYRLAQLLVDSRFHQALKEAEEACRQGNILQEDLNFIREIFDAAQNVEEHTHHF